MASSGENQQPTHAGVAVQAADTGRVLMLQRSLDPTDAPDVQGTWEFPGGSIEHGETPSAGAWREFGEETGLPKPKGETVTSWTSPNGVYQGFVHRVPVEADAFDELNPDRGSASTVNPDDPDRDNPEVTAWFDPEHVRNLGAALRPEVADMDWSVFDGCGPSTAEAWAPLSPTSTLLTAVSELQRTALLGPVLAELAGQETPGSAGGEERLKTWWRTHFDWGTPGDFDACVARATQVFGEHGVDIDPKAWCARIHHDVTGAWPGHAPGEQSAHESAEEAPMGDDLTLVETVTIDEAAAKAASKTGRFLMQFISPGWGSSGYYSPKVLQEAARDNLIPAGTHMYADHPTAAEAKARPARSIKDLMAVTTEDARLAEDGALVGEVEVVPSWRPFVESVHQHIGASIRGDAKDIKPGMAEGRRGPIVEGLAHVQSVDFVTRAGRGGRVLELLESAVAEGADIREDLAKAVEETTPPAPTHVPAARPDDKKEARMGIKEIEESEYGRLTEAAGRVPTLEADLTTARSNLVTAQGELTEARAALVPNRDLREAISGLITENATLRAREVAAPMIAEALADALIGEAAMKRIAGELLEGITLKDGEPGQRPTLDTAVLTEAINAKVRVAEAEAQELREAMGMTAPGQPRGLGRPGGGLLVEQKVGEYAETTAGAIGKAFGLSEDAAKTAGKGRI